MQFSWRNSNQDFNINNPNETTPAVLIFTWIKKLSAEEDKVPRTVFEAWKVAGSATYKYSMELGCCSFSSDHTYYIVYL